MRVEVYRNLTKACFSIRPLEGESKNRVVFHATTVVLAGPVTFVVQPAGSADVKASRVKNVHAYVRGSLAFVKSVYPIVRSKSAPNLWLDGDYTYTGLLDSAMAALAPGRKLRRMIYDPFNATTFEEVCEDGKFRPILPSYGYAAAILSINGETKSQISAVM